MRHIALQHQSEERKDINLEKMKEFCCFCDDRKDIGRSLLIRKRGLVFSIIRNQHLEICS